MIESKKNSYLSVPKNNLISFMIGGNNRHYKFTKENIKNVFLKITENFIKKNFQLIIVPSIRTPKDIIKFANEKMKGINCLINNASLFVS